MKTLLSSLYLFLLVGCGNSIEVKEERISDFQGISAGEELNFEVISSQILRPHCLRCHAGYSDYEIVYSDRNNIRDAILNERMPKNAPALDESLKKLIDQWVDLGAPFDSQVSEPVETKLVANWVSLSKKIFIPKCVQCHNPSGQASFLDLSSRQKFFENRDYLLGNFEDAKTSYLIEVLTDNDEPMPPKWSNIERLTSEEINIVVEWIEKGLP